MAIPQLDTGQVLGPAMQQAEAIKTSRQGRSIRQAASEQALERGGLQIDKLKADKARRGITEGREDKEYQYQSNRRVLNMAMKSLPLVENAQQYQEFRQYAIDEMGVNPQEIPELDPNMSDEQWNEIHPKLMAAVEDKSAEYRFETFKTNNQIRIENERAANRMMVLDKELQNKLANQKDESGKKLTPKQRLDVLSSAVSDYRYENDLYTWGEPDENGNREITGTKPLTDEDKKKIAEMVDERIGFGEEVSGDEGSELDTLAEEVGIELK
ncbi:MAG: hypothetical protein KOO63_05530 [Bacteroidales bacterium]|nr:hypothetical protein [Candidatus Latescibacterota bacterium]